MAIEQPTRRRLRLALGPIPYFWPRERVFDFYRQAAGWPVDSVYLGEIVCARRRELKPEDWLGIADELAGAGKEAILSTLTLVEAATELGALRRHCRNARFGVEANDMAAVEILSGLGVAFVGGPTLNVYNAQTLAVLADAGMRRWVPPVELSGRDLAALLANAPAGCGCEVFAWGRLPLAFSARCFTARAEDRPKDRCGFACLEDPQGRLVHTRDNEPFLVLNGIQTQSALTQNLAHELADLERLPVTSLRLAPQPDHMDRIVALFRNLIDGGPDPGAIAELDGLAPTGTCTGYWHGNAGFARPGAGTEP